MQPPSFTFGSNPACSSFPTTSPSQSMIDYPSTPPLSPPSAGTFPFPSSSNAKQGTNFMIMTQFITDMDEAMKKAERDREMRSGAEGSESEGRGRDGGAFTFGMDEEEDEDIELHRRKRERSRAPSPPRLPFALLSSTSSSQPKRYSINDLFPSLAQGRGAEGVGSQVGAGGNYGYREMDATYAGSSDLEKLQGVSFAIGRGRDGSGGTPQGMSRALRSKRRELHRATQSSGISSRVMETLTEQTGGIELGSQADSPVSGMSGVRGDFEMERGGDGCGMDVNMSESGTPEMSREARRRSARLSKQY